MEILRETDADASQALARKIGLPLLTCYGLGTILGAGIYVLVGKVAGNAGILAPMAFLVAAIVAGVTALSYSQLVVLYPRSAGEACYVEASFGKAWLTKAVGYLVLLTGVVSAATLVKGFLGYLTTFVELQPLLGVVLVVSLIGALAFSGIAESLWVAGLITVLEVLGLLIVLILLRDSFQGLYNNLPALLFPTDFSTVIGLMAGSFLAFYAFIGFEDMVNIVEEVKTPSVMPKAILIALCVATILYVLIAMVAVLSMPLEQLANSDAPIRDLLQKSYPNVATAVAVLSLLAIINGVLAQIIMGSRILYGMSCQNRAPKLFSTVSPRTKTPSVATLLVSLLTAGFAIWLPLEQLAKTTSFIVLSVFFLVNLALWRIKTLDSELLKKGPNRIPSIPVVGSLLCLSLVIFQLFSYL